MRRSRRGGGSGAEFGGSGEDSFVAVVVTKLTGALLFILLLTMVIMALLPKAVDVDLAEKADHNAGERKPRSRSRSAHRTAFPKRPWGVRTCWRWRRRGAAIRCAGARRASSRVAQA